MGHKPSSCHSLISPWMAVCSAGAHLGLRLVATSFVIRLFSLRGCSTLGLRGWRLRGVLRRGFSFLLKLSLLSRFFLASLSRALLFLLGDNYRNPRGYIYY